MSDQKRRQSSEPWRHIYGRDRKYTRRFDAAADRGQLTEPGTNPNSRNEAKIARKRRARDAAEVWRRLEAIPGFNEALAQGERELAAGLGTPFREIRRDE